jgi:hypothetical protein
LEIETLIAQWLFWLVTFTIAIMVGRTWFVLLKAAGRSKFYSALVDAYGRDRSESAELDATWSAIGWIDDGSSSPFVSTHTRTHVTARTLEVRHKFGTSRFISSLSIPLVDLEYQGQRAFWGAALRFDAFRVSGLVGGELLLPKGLLPRDCKQNCVRTRSGNRRDDQSRSLGS